MPARTTQRLRPTHAPRGSLKPVCLAAGLALTGAGWALPTGGSVTQGQATVTTVKPGQLLIQPVSGHLRSAGVLTTAGDGITTVDGTLTNESLVQTDGLLPEGALTFDLLMARCGEIERAANAAR